MQRLGRIYIDTNIFIAAFETESDLAAKAAYLLFGAKTQQPQRFVTSELTLAELLVQPFRRNDITLTELYSSLISSSNHLDIRSVTREVLVKSASLRAATPSLKLPDAIHLATASLSGCNHILSADKGLGAGAMQNLPLQVLRPDEPTLNSLIESLGR